MEWARGARARGQAGGSARGLARFPGSPSSSLHPSSTPGARSRWRGPALQEKKSLTLKENVSEARWFDPDPKNRALSVSGALGSPE